MRKVLAAYPVSRHLIDRLGLVTGMSGLAPNWEILATNWTNLGLLKISFQSFGSARLPK